MGSIQVEEELLAGVLALPETEREGYLQRACATDPQLHARMDSLLRAFAASDSFLDDLPDAVAALLTDPRLSQREEIEGSKLGNYRVVRELGEGGCGVVYLAEQLAPVRREVALKVIKLGMDTRSVIARFAAEQQALALMNHPHIAQVLDAGATPAGRPYFVMELVRGVKITQYCDQSGLGVRERLELFIQVCQAIQHAHHKGILHRDIKPSNVLVTLHDDVPTVKVIDFGIAKAMQGRLTDQTLYTALDQFIGTPAYVSPEQTQLGGIEVDTRSDVYSLGVLLYELLTGRTPFDTADLARTSLDAMKQRIREEEPPAPSKRLSTLDEEALSAAGERRRQDGASLVQLVQRDLDWVVMRCLEKEPARRYQTAHELASDVQRYLADEPVVARPPSALYTFRKFARRYRVILATGTAISGVLLIATLISTWWAVQAVRAQKLARSEATQRQEVIDFLEKDLLAQASPEHEPDRDLKLRTVLDRAAQKIPQRFTGQPLVEASIRTTLGTTYGMLGEYAASFEHFERAAAIYQEQLGADDARTLKAQAELLPVLLFQGNFAQAQPLAERLFELEQRVFGPEHPDTLTTMTILAAILAEQGNLDAAEPLQVRSLELRRRVLGPEHPDTLVAMNELAVTYQERDRLAEAEALQKQTLEIDRRVWGPEHPGTLIAMNNLAFTYQKAEKYREAAALHTQALEIRRRVLGPEHLDTLMTMSNLAATYDNLGKTAQAQALNAQALETSRRVLEPEHPFTFSVLNNLATNYRAQGKLGEAEKLQRQALEGTRKALGPEHAKTLLVMLNLATTYERAAKLVDAQALLSEGLAISKRVLGPEHRDTLDYADRLGEVLVRRGRFAEAESLLRPALAARKKRGAEDWRLFSTQSRLGEALSGLGRLAEAETVLIESHRGLKQHEQHMPPKHQAEIDTAAARIVNLYAAWGKPQQARQWQLAAAERK